MACTLTVNNLPASFPTTEVQQYFSKIGRVLDFRSTSVSSGEVVYENSEIAMKAIRMYDGREFGGKMMSLQFSQHNGEERHAPSVKPSSKFEKYLYIPVNAKGMIIGRGGERVKTIRESSGVQTIRIQDLDGSDSVAYVLLVGFRPKVEKAEELVKKYLDEGGVSFVPKPPNVPQPQSLPTPPARKTTFPVRDKKPVQNRGNYVDKTPSNSENKKSSILIQVTAVSTPCEFFAQVVDEKTTMILKTNVENLNDYCSKVADDINQRCQPIIGGIYGSRYHLDNLFYRAKVLTVLSNQKCLVRYIDFGDCCHVPASSLIPLPDGLNAAPPMAHPFHIEGVELEPDLVNADQAFEDAVKLINDKQFRIDIELKENDRSNAIDLDIGGKMLSEFLLEQGYVRRCIPVRHNASSNAEKCASPVKSPNTLLQQLDVDVSHVSHPCEFSGIIISKENESNLTFISRYLSENQSRLVQTTSRSLKNNQIFLARFTEDSNFYRCKIVKEAQCPLGKVTVRYIDFGNSEEIPITDLFDIPEELKGIPPLATLFRFDGVMPKHQPGTSNFHQGAMRLSALLLNQRVQILSQQIINGVAFCSFCNKEKLQTLLEQGFIVPTENDDTTTSPSYHGSGSPQRSTSQSLQRQNGRDQHDHYSPQRNSSVPSPVHNTKSTLRPSASPDAFNSVVHTNGRCSGNCAARIKQLELQIKHLERSNLRLKEDYDELMKFKLELGNSS